MNIVPAYPARHFLNGPRIFGRYFLLYFAIWAAATAGLTAISHPLLKHFADRQVKSRLLSDAAIIDEYLAMAGSFSPANREQLDLLCKRLDQPALRDTWVTLFSDKTEVIADSRLPIPAAERMRSRPEVEAALRQAVGTTVRYSQIAHRRMAFLALPHEHLGEVQGAVRVGVPYSTVDDSLWWAYVKIAAAGLGLSLIAASIRTLYRGLVDRKDG